MKPLPLPTTNQPNERDFGFHRGTVPSDVHVPGNYADENEHVDARKILESFIEKNNIKESFYIKPTETP